MGKGRLVALRLLYKGPSTETAGSTFPELSADQIQTCPTVSHGHHFKHQGRGRLPLTPRHFHLSLSFCSQLWRSLTRSNLITSNGMKQQGRTRRRKSRTRIPQHHTSLVS